MARILLENIAKVFDGKIAAVSDFTLEIPDGRFMVIVGPSGSGKTTVLRLVAGLEQPDRGNISIDGVCVNNMASKDRDIAMVFQNYTLYPHMTAYQNMAFALKMRKCSGEQIKKRVDEVAKLLGIEQLLSRKPRALSGGQRQRVALGKAMVRRPKVFLFDEPLSNIDPGMRLAMRHELKILHQKLAATIIYVTHDQTEAMTLGEEVCVINNGIIQQVASPQDIYHKPANKFVAGFFGTPPMNFFEGRLKYENGSASFAAGGELIALPKQLYQQLYNYQDKEMLLGVRPENISISSIDGQQHNAISAMIQTVESTGSRIDLFFNTTCSGKHIASTTECPKINTAAQIKMYIDLRKIHIFESGHPGRNITSII
jgi:multiple sugar transport system ATP-binding protein